MLDFFIVLFGGSYLASNMINERRTKRENDRVRSAFLEWNKLKRAELAATKEESDTILSNYKTDQRMAMAEVADALVRVYGPNYEDTIQALYRNVVNGDKSVDFRFWLRQLLYAKHCKLDPEMWYPSYPLGGGKYIKINVGLCKEIEKYLHDAGHKEMLLGSPMPADRIDNPCFSPIQNKMEWMCPGAWGNNHRLW